MALTVIPTRQRPADRPSGSVVPGLLLVALGVVSAAALSSAVPSLALIVAAVVVGAVLGNRGMVTPSAVVGVAFASKTLLRAGIVLLGLRLSVGDVASLGWTVLVVIAITVITTFFAVQWFGHRLGLSPSLSLLVASGFSICGNSAIASVSGAVDVDDDEIAAAIGLVTLCGTAAIVAVPALGSALGLTDMQLGVWAGAGVQDTAQVIAVGSAAGPAVLAVATAVKLTRVLFLAPIVAGVASARGRDRSSATSRRPTVLPLFVAGFVAAVGLRTVGVLPAPVLDVGRSIEQYLLAAGMVGLGSSVRVDGLRRLGPRPLALGLLAWAIVAGVSLCALTVTGV